MDAICILNKHLEFLFINKFNPNAEKSLFDNFLNYLNESNIEDLSPFKVIEDVHYAYIFRDELYWCVYTKENNFARKCGSLSLVDNLISFHLQCSALIGNITQNSITANTVVIQEILLESMCCGYMQLTDIQKLKSMMYAEIAEPKETSLTTLTAGMFGAEKIVPTTASQKSLLMTDDTKKEMFLDVVEKIWATIGPDNVVLRMEINGKISLKFIFSSPSPLNILFNANLQQTPKEGFEPKIQLCDVECGSDCKISNRELKTMANPGEAVLLTYSVPLSAGAVLPFSLNIINKKITNGDVELTLKLHSLTRMGSIAPYVTVQMIAPSSTSSVTSRTNGPNNQSVNFDETSKIIKWTTIRFPGGCMAQTHLRLNDAAESDNSTLSTATLNFEVSKWTPSGLRIENVILKPPVSHPNQMKCDYQKYERYLTISDTVTFKFNS